MCCVACVLHLRYFCRWHIVWTSPSKVSAASSRTVFVHPRVDMSYIRLPTAFTFRATAEMNCLAWFSVSVVSQAWTLWCQNTVETILAKQEPVSVHSDSLEKSCADYVHAAVCNPCKEHLSSTWPSILAPAMSTFILVRKVHVLVHEARDCAQQCHPMRIPKGTHLTADSNWSTTYVRTRLSDQNLATQTALRHFRNACCARAILKITLHGSCLNGMNSWRTGYPLVSPL